MKKMTMVLVLMFLSAMAAAEVNDVNANSELVKVPDIKNRGLFVIEYGLQKTSGFIPAF